MGTGYGQNSFKLFRYSWILLKYSKRSLKRASRSTKRRRGGSSRTQGFQQPRFEPKKPKRMGFLRSFFAGIVHEWTSNVGWTYITQDPGTGRVQAKWYPTYELCMQRARADYEAGRVEDVMTMRAVNPHTGESAHTKFNVSL